MTTDTSLTPDLRAWNDKIRVWAAEAGLDFYDTIFELVDSEELNEIAAYGGFPTRYAHWRHGMSYDQLSKQYSWGLGKIYELVINNDPCYAYLMRGNEMVAQKLVMAHVYAHCDFFKNNVWFSRTNRKMMDEMANHATRIQRYIERHGQNEVEQFLDAAHSIEDLIDPYAPFSERRPEPPRYDFEGMDRDSTAIVVRKMLAKDYMDTYINPPEFLEKEREKIKARKEQEKRFPEHPQKDLLAFLIEHGQLQNWQRDALEIVRKEAYYFAPQRMTKIMNEGWASYWHSRLMTEKISGPEDIIHFADLHAGTMAGGGALNPYKLGLTIFRDIEERWNTGRHGKDYDECDDMDARARWDTGEMKGREKIFEVRRFYNDIGFIDEFLTQDFCERHKLFTYEYNEHMDRYEIASRAFEEIKEKLLFQLTNFGQPYITVVDGNYRNRGELLVVHDITRSKLNADISLRMDWAMATLRNLSRLWGRPVNLHTNLDGRNLVITFDGEEFREHEGTP